MPSLLLKAYIKALLISPRSYLPGAYNTQSAFSGIPNKGTFRSESSSFRSSIDHCFLAKPAEEAPLIFMAVLPEYDGVSPP